METILGLWNSHPLWCIFGGLVVALAGVNHNLWWGKWRRSKPRSVPAQAIVDMTAEMLEQACKLDPAERNAINELVDKIKHISQQTIIEPPGDEQ